MTPVYSNHQYVPWIMLRLISLCFVVFHCSLIPIELMHVLQAYITATGISYDFPSGSEDIYHNKIKNYKSVSIICGIYCEYISIPSIHSFSHIHIWAVKAIIFQLRRFWYDKSCPMGVFLIEEKCLYFKMFLCNHLMFCEGISHPLFPVQPMTKISWTWHFHFGVISSKLYELITKWNMDPKLYWYI